MGPRKCLLCYQNCLGGDITTQNSEMPTRFLCGPQLETVFLLRTVFEVPKKRLEEYMLKNGQDPSEWLSICRDCKKYVEKASKAFKDVSKAQKIFRKVKGDIIQLLRRNNSTNDSAGTSTELSLTKETRQFVNENDYSSSLVNPFVEGDCQAERLLFSSTVAREGVVNENENDSSEHVVEIDPALVKNDEDYEPLSDTDILDVSPEEGNSEPGNDFTEDNLKCENEEIEMTTKKTPQISTPTASTSQSEISTPHCSASNVIAQTSTVPPPTPSHMPSPPPSNVSTPPPSPLPPILEPYSPSAVPTTSSNPSTPAQKILIPLPKKKTRRSAVKKKGFYKQIIQGTFNKGKYTNKRKRKRSRKTENTKTSSKETQTESV